ncbi:MAG: LytTR family DNA-binding domain-containing protein [Acidobacteriota bacterium]
MRLQALVIDDEPPARKKIRMFLKDDPRVEVVGEASDGLEAIEAIERLAPDLIFLDIQMPHLNGFEVLAEIKTRPLPLIIFATAYDQYALKAFEVRALDYLLKPFDEERLAEALERAFSWMSNHSQWNQKIDDLITELKGGQKHLQRILLKTVGKIILIKTEEIDWIDAEEKYVRLHIGKERHLYRETMNTLEQQLDPEKFIRIHRSYIINIDFLKEIVPWSNNDYIVVLKDGTQLNLGRNYRDRLLKMGLF